MPLLLLLEKTSINSPDNMEGNSSKMSRPRRMRIPRR
jgi:hypothetical protein